jgi:large subunit ribosomal protein L23
MRNYKSPYEIITSRYITEKTTVLKSLQKAEGNPCLKKCQKPKYVFLVDVKANKNEIAKAVEEIYAENNIKVTSVNIINTKPKMRCVRGKFGQTVARKKAIVTLANGNVIEEPF